MVGRQGSARAGGEVFGVVVSLQGGSVSNPPMFVRTTPRALGVLARGPDLRIDCKACKHPDLQSAPNRYSCFSPSLLRRQERSQARRRTEAGPGNCSRSYVFFALSFLLSQHVWAPACAGVTDKSGATRLCAFCCQASRRPDLQFLTYEPTIYSASPRSSSSMSRSLGSIVITRCGNGISMPSRRNRSRMAIRSSDGVRR